MKNLSRAVCFSLFFCLFLALGRVSHGQAVVINEIAWMGDQNSANDEWIELYNNTDSPVDLTGWEISAEDGTPKITLAGIIPASGFYLLERTDDNTVPEVSADQIYTGALGNAGENLALYNNTQNIVEKIQSNAGWYAGSNETKQTMERIDSVKLGVDPGNWKNSENPGGTPKKKNGTVSPAIQTQEEPIRPENGLIAEIQQPINQPQDVSYPSGIIINEILASPSGSDETEEWIEISNQNQFEVDLSGWQIRDSVGTLKIFVIPSVTKIPALGFLVFKRPDTKIVLNNDGDGVSLIQPNGQIIETVSYPKSPLNQSYSRVDSGWFWSSQLTPGTKNIMPESASRSIETVISDKTVGLSENLPVKEGLAAIGQAVKNNFVISLIALAAAIISAVAILILKKSLNKFKNF